MEIAMGYLVNSIKSCLSGQLSRQLLVILLLPVFALAKGDNVPLPKSAKEQARIEKKKKDKLLIQENNKKIFQAFREIQTKQSLENLNRIIKHQKNIIGIEILTAAPVEGAPIQSKFGHLMIRFVNAPVDGVYDTWSADKVISFVADVDEPKLSYKKGIFGGYQVTMQVDTVGNFWTQYAQWGGRNIERYVVPTSKVVREKLFLALERYKNEGVGEYTFFKGNCAGKMNELFEIIGLPSKGSGTIIPTKFDEWMEKSLLSPWPKLVMNSKKELLNDAIKTLELSGKPMASESFPKDMLSRLKSKYTDVEIITITNMLLEYMPMEFVEEVRPIFEANNFEDSYEHTFLAPEFYELCLNHKCGSSLMSEAELMWSKEELNKKFNQNKASFESMPRNEGQERYFLREYYNQMFVLTTSAFKKGIK